MKKSVRFLSMILMFAAFVLPVSAQEIGTEKPCNSEISVCAAGELEYSIVADITYPNYSSFNCYAYSIGRFNVWLNPGGLSDTVYQKEANVYRMAQLVVQDLEHIGYQNVRILAASDFSQALCSELVIALRIKQGEEFHFMRYDYSDGNWYHKPGSSAILQYIGDPLASGAVWTNEQWLNGQYEPKSLEYDSAILCIAAGTEHHYNRYTYCGNNRHILTCIGCTLTTGSASDCIMLGNTCRVCGHAESTDGGFDIMSAESP